MPAVKLLNKWAKRHRLASIEKASGVEATRIFAITALDESLNKDFNRIFIGTALKCMEMLSKISGSSHATFFLNSMSLEFDSYDLFSRVPVTYLVSTEYVPAMLSQPWEFHMRP